MERMIEQYNPRIQVVTGSYLAVRMSRVTEAGTIGAIPFVGKGDPMVIDAAAVEAMERELRKIKNFRVKNISCEGFLDGAAEVGDSFGEGESGVDMAVDPIENTKAAARGTDGSVSTLAVFLNKGHESRKIADGYMEKLGYGKEVCKDIPLDAPTVDKVNQIAKDLGIKVSEVKIAVLKRSRNEKLIAEILEAGAQVELLNAGDLMPGINACFSKREVHAIMGIGGAPEGVITAAGVKCFDGTFKGRLCELDEEGKLIEKAEIDLDEILTEDSLIPSDQIGVCFTGVTDGKFCNLVKARILNDGKNAKTSTIELYKDGKDKSGGRMVYRVHDLGSGKRKVIDSQRIV